jgi:hypothetical protein
LGYNGVAGAGETAIGNALQTNRVRQALESAKIFYHYPSTILYFAA